MASRISSASKQAELLKDQGNLYFKKERFGAAIDAYTEAITLCSDVPVYWTNRALCHRKRNEWERMESDCRKALELDKHAVKAHYMLGLALLQRECYAEAVKHLEKALELSRGGKPTSYMVEEIWRELAKAKYIEWEVVSNARRKKQKEVREICEKALKEEYEAAVKKLKDKEGKLNDIKQLNDTRISDMSMGEVILIEDDERVDSGEMEADDFQSTVDTSKVSELSRLNLLYKERLQALSEIFNKAGSPDKPAEIPEYLCCGITMDIFRDPVITPSGVTYERAVLLEHLRKVGKFDPLTRADLQPNQVVSNLAIKEGVQAFLAENGWAYKIA
ncbi:hypothetical protein O6H91_11G049300 [Diphasiastrum complanatum]|uniref:Uncharacterized protein n=2 Tax=Diphasiastrum complanatum TaxID=34168 RepID=A0ACC2C8Y8_DIPCM|nr:hypothetical protein O6H91_11G049300 [Diphasiastrum complanatum]KAJ7538471.1 hypothetical protein O6H91_11G049300 [Diphasiastrum complanatum]